LTKEIPKCFRNNRRNGNRYLSWAYVEAANFANRFCPHAQAFYQRKMAKTNGLVAIKALSNKLARASYYVMRDQVPYDMDKLFRKVAGIYGIKELE